MTVSVELEEENRMIIDCSFQLKSNLKKDIIKDAYIIFDKERCKFDRLF